MIDPVHPLAELLRRDKRYRLGAYVFVYEALQYAQQQQGLARADADPTAPDAEEERHVTGQQLCEAVRQYAVEQYGGLAKNVLAHWGIRSTSDFGEIVFNLIAIGQMRKTE